MKPLALALLTLLPLQAGERLYGDTYAYIDRIVDGDSFVASVPCWPMIAGDSITIRLRGVDTPELRSRDTTAHRRAVAARDTLAKYLPIGSRVRLDNLGRDKFFRIDADVSVGGRSLAAVLIQAGLGIPYFGGAR